MPFTFLAHQAPVLPIKRRHPDRWDGLALVVGSMAPDLAYVSSGTGYGPFGIPLWFDGHGLQNQVSLMLCSVALTVIVRRVVLPVAPLALPQRAAPLRDALLAASRHRHRWWVTAYSALVGALTHLALDAFTHRHGYVVSNVPVLRTPMFEVFGRGIAPYAVLQYGGTVILGIWCVFLMRRWWEAAAAQSVTNPAEAIASLDPVGVGLLGGCATLGVVLASVIAPTRTGLTSVGGEPYRYGASVAVITWCWIAFLGALLGCVLARPYVSHDRAVHQPRSIHS